LKIPKLRTQAMVPLLGVGFNIIIKVEEIRV